MKGRTKLLTLALIIIGISVVKIIDKMSADDPIAREAFVSISLNRGLSLKRKVLVTVVLVTAGGTFVFFEKKYPLIKLIKNKLYTIGYPIFLKVKACKSIFHRTRSTETDKTSEFCESTNNVQSNEQVEVTTSSGVKVTFLGNSNEASISPVDRNSWLLEHPI